MDIIGQLVQSTVHYKTKKLTRKNNISKQMSIHMDSGYEEASK